MIYAYLVVIIWQIFFDIVFNRYFEWAYRAHLGELKINVIIRPIRLLDWMPRDDLKFLFSLYLTRKTLELPYHEPVRIFIK